MVQLIKKVIRTQNSMFQVKRAKTADKAIKATRWNLQAELIVMKK
jgi:hypothetical protein